MTTIPTQPAGSDTCKACGEPIRLVNAQQGPQWVHGDSPWCGPAGSEPTTKAVPASRPWPELA